MDPHPPMQGGPFSPPIAPYNVAQMWSFPDGAGDPRRGHFGQNLGFLETSSRDLPVEESTVTEQSGSHGGGRKRRDAAAAASEDDSSKLASTSGGNDMQTDCSGKRLKVAGLREENEYSKTEVEVGSGNGNKPVEQSAQSSEALKQDYIHVRARRGQATDSHSLAERARREKISERMKILQDLVPGCNKVIGKALVLDEIINYIQSLQRQVEFLSMKLEAVNSRINASTEGFPAKDEKLVQLSAEVMKRNLRGGFKRHEGPMISNSPLPVELMP